MAFKKVQPPSTVADSPDELLRDLPRRKIPDVLPHQRAIMRSYAASELNAPDVALQLPTGSGKTLVGLLIAEWRRRKHQERVVYLCTTRQLVNQVVEQAEEKYGLSVLGFTGPIRDFEPTAKAEYRGGDRIAVTTYSSLFNTNPYFDDADLLIVDDVHAGESYISDLWSVGIDRSSAAQQALHIALRNAIKPHIDAASFARIAGEWESPGDRGWVDKLPTPAFASIQNELAAILDAHVGALDLRYPWSKIREHLPGCQLYFSSQQILIRPLIPPTWTHAPFSNPKQRVYMSATLGLGGDLERLLGRHPIRRLEVPEGWDRQGVGRRFFIFPGMSLKEDQIPNFRRKLMQFSGRSLVLVPSDKMRGEIAEDIGENLHFPTFSASDIEDSKKPFISQPEAVAIVANRYDGIDFPGDECRLLFIEGLPKVTNLQERFLMARMGANVLFNERIQTRVVQAIGRCTRSLEDYSAVVVSGEELPDYLTDIRRRKYLHPELQAELAFGVDQSKDTTLKDMVDNFQVFLKNGREWEVVNQQIVVARTQAAQQPFPAMEDLRKIVGHEIEFQARLWQSDYGAAVAAAEGALAGLTVPELRGYRALWNYLAGAAACLGDTIGKVPGMSAKARMHFDEAKSAASGIPWLVRLSQYESKRPAPVETDIVLMEQIERVENILEQLGTVHDRSFAKREKEILEGLASATDFEHAHRLLGEVVGFQVGKIEAEGSPDPWWLAGTLCFVFEDHAGAEPDSAIDVKKARQVSSHPKWMNANVAASSQATILPVLVTTVTEVRSAALPYLDGVGLWPVAELRKFAERAFVAVRELRKTFVEPGDLEWRAKAQEVFTQNGLAAAQLFTELESKPASRHLQEI